MSLAAKTVQATAVSFTAGFGALCFGVVIGWFLYYVNRYRSDKVGITDIGTLIGAVGGAAVLTLFPAGGGLFGLYGIGLAVGFFTYFLVLVILVAKSGRFTVDFFLDGRAPALGKDERETRQRPLGTEETERK